MYLHVTCIIGSLHVHDIVLLNYYHYVTQITTSATKNVIDAYVSIISIVCDDR